MIAAVSNTANTRNALMTTLSRLIAPARAHPGRTKIDRRNYPRSARMTLSLPSACFAVP
jgi:hypothetical protein